MSNATRPTGNTPAGSTPAMGDWLEAVARDWAASHPEHVRDLQAIKAEGVGIRTSDRRFLDAAEAAWCKATGL